MAAPQSDIVRFQFNVPVSCVLRYPKHKLINTKFGERAMFSLNDGRVMFLEPQVAESVEMLSLHPGEEFFIAKRSTRDRGEYWDVWLAPDTEKIRARKETGAAAIANAAPSPDVQSDISVSVPSIPESILEDARRKLAAYHELCVWAKANFEGITRNEVRAILMNSMISAERNGVRR